MYKQTDAVVGKIGTISKSTYTMWLNEKFADSDIDWPVAEATQSRLKTDSKMRLFNPFVWPCCHNCNSGHCLFSAPVNQNRG